MMKTKLSTLAFGAGLLLAGTASAFYMPSAFYPNGYYLGTGLGYSSLDLGTLNVKKGSVTLQNTSPDSAKQPDALLKFGYMFKRFPAQFDLSYQQTLGFDYDASPLFSGRTDKLSSTITTHTLFANVTLDGNFGFPVIPFVTGGIGMGMNSVDMSYTNAGERFKHTKDTFHEAWQLGVGAHIKMTDNWLFNLMAYHQNLGKLTWGPWGSNPVYELQNDALTASQVQLGVTYVFGDQHIPPSLINDN